MTDLSDFARLVPREHGLIVISTLRGDGTIQSSVVNAGVLDHPFTGKPAPREAAGLDWLAGMGPENVEEFGAAEAGPAELTAFLEREAADLGSVTGASIIEGLGGLLGDADKAVLTGEYADHMAASLHASVGTGLDGWFEDDQAFVAGWGFSFGADAAPVAIWQGGDDRMVPFGHGQWLAAHIPGAQAHLLPGEGHLSLSVNHYGQILDDLLALAGRAA